MVPSRQVAAKRHRPVAAEQHRPGSTAPNTPLVHLPRLRPQSEYPELAWDPSLFALAVLGQFVQPAVVGMNWVTG